MLQSEKIKESEKIMADTTFKDILSHELLLQNLVEKMGFTSPTPIQVAVAKTIAEGRNLFAGAKTGSGKTVAFLAPLSQRILNDEIRNILVLAPTRELVLQIDEEAAKLLDGQSKAVPVALYGGVPIDPQVLVIKHHKPRIFIGTPGRIIDFSTEGVLPFGEIDAVVLDEADRMCDMGFAPQVTDILEMCVNSKQVLMFSATLPPELTTMMNRYCADPVRIQVDAADKSSETIKHQVLFCRRRTKLPKLKALLLKESYVGVIFTRTRLGADQIFREVRPSIKEIGILHAGYGMNDREKTIRAFRDEKINLLVATDVASRGLDINHLNAVIQYDPPESLEDYIHRSGRSGRAGRTGLSILFIEEDNPDQLRFFEELKKKVKFDILDANPSSNSSNELKTTKTSAPLTQAAKKVPISPPKVKDAGLAKSWKARAIETSKYWLRVLFKG